MTWSLATIESHGQPVACLECGPKLYRLEPTLARAGAPGMVTAMDLFADWERSLAAITAGLATLDDADLMAPGPRLAPLLYPGKILCAGANYYDHLAEMGMPGRRRRSSACSSS